VASWRDANLAICSDVESSIGWGWTMKLNTLCLLEVDKWLNALFAGLIVLPRSKSKFAENVPELKYQEIASRQPK
jgi:hypothetical protein